MLFGNYDWLMLTKLFGAISFLVISHFAYAEDSAKPDQTLSTAAAIGPDGRLWRVVPSQEKVEVDFSFDYGKTFSKPV